MGSSPSFRALPEPPEDAPPPSRTGRRTLSIRELPLGERPRERLKALGAQSLSSAELLAILLGAGTAQASALRVGEEMLARTEGSLRRLAMQPVAALTAQSGVGTARAVAETARIRVRMNLASMAQLLGQGNAPAACLFH